MTFIQKSRETVKVCVRVKSLTWVFLLSVAIASLRRTKHAIPLTSRLLYFTHTTRPGINGVCFFQYIFTDFGIYNLQHVQRTFWGLQRCLNPLCNSCIFYRNIQVSAETLSKDRTIWCTLTYSQGTSQTTLQDWGITLNQCKAKTPPGLKLDSLQELEWQCDVFNLNFIDNQYGFSTVK